MGRNRSLEIPHERVQFLCKQAENVRELNGLSGRWNFAQAGCASHRSHSTESARITAPKTENRSVGGSTPSLGTIIVKTANIRM
jgi:hypothetical protein